HSRSTSNTWTHTSIHTHTHTHKHTQLGSSELVEKMSTTSTLFIFYEALYDTQLMRSFTVKTGRCYDRQRSAKGDCCSFALSSWQTTTVIMSAMVIQLHSHI